MVHSILWFRPLGRVSDTNPLFQLRPKLNANREGQLGNKVKKWKKDEPGQWIRVVSLPPRRTSQMAFVPAREIQSAPTGASLMPTSTLGAGEGSMASPYVQCVCNPSAIITSSALTLFFCSGPLSGRAPVSSGTNRDYGSSYFGSRSGYNSTVGVNSGNATGPSISQNYNDGYGKTKQGTPPSAFMPVTLCEGCNRPEGEGNHFSCEIWNA